MKSTAPYLVWTGMRVVTTFYLNAGSTGSQLRSMHFDGGGLFLRAAKITVTDSEFEGGHSIDGIQVGNASDVLIEDNTIHDYDQSIDNGYHADCLQIFDSSRVTVRGNRIANCYNAGVILSPGGGTGMTDIVIESNFIQSCVVRSPLCGGGSAVDLRPPKITGLVFRSNTVLAGSTRLTASPGLVADRNILGYLSDCAAP
ncbi:right-handed parallel beta-helix repeat-containing protein, partial [Schumannella luteola]